MTISFVSVTVAITINMMKITLKIIDDLTPIDIPKLSPHSMDHEIIIENANRKIAKT